MPKSIDKGADESAKRMYVKVPEDYFDSEQIQRDFYDEIVNLLLASANAQPLKQLTNSGYRVMFSGSNSASETPAGSAAKASSVGANTVNGSPPLSLVTKFATINAVNKVAKRSIATPTSTTVPSAGVSTTGVASSTELPHADSVKGAAIAKALHTSKTPKINPLYPELCRSRGEKYAQLTTITQAKIDAV